MSKRIHVTMKDGSVWAFPAEIVAKRRAQFYADLPGAAQGDYDQEFEYAMRHHYELTDWAVGNMNWSDVAPHAVQIEPPAEADYEDSWLYGDMEVREADDVPQSV